MLGRGHLDRRLSSHSGGAVSYLLFHQLARGYILTKFVESDGEVD